MREFVENYCTEGLNIISGKTATGKSLALAHILSYRMFKSSNEYFAVLNPDSPAIFWYVLKSILDIEINRFRNKFLGRDNQQIIKDRISSILSDKISITSSNKESSFREKTDLIKDRLFVLDSSELSIEDMLKRLPTGELWVKKTNIFILAPLDHCMKMQSDAMVSAIATRARYVQNIVKIISKFKSAWIECQLNRTSFNGYSDDLTGIGMSEQYSASNIFRVNLSDDRKSFKFQVSKSRKTTLHQEILTMELECDLKKISRERNL